jgi:hypothetical protein
MKRNVEVRPQVRRPVILSGFAKKTLGGLLSLKSTGKFISFFGGKKSRSDRSFACEYVDMEVPREQRKCSTELFNSSKISVSNFKLLHSLNIDIPSDNSIPIGGSGITENQSKSVRYCGLGGSSEIKRILINYVGEDNWDLFDWKLNYWGHTSHGDSNFIIAGCCKRKGYGGNEIEFILIQKHRNFVIVGNDGGHRFAHTNDWSYYSTCCACGDWFDVYKKEPHFDDIEWIVDHASNEFQDACLDVCHI